LAIAPATAPIAAPARFRVATRDALDKLSTTRRFDDGPHRVDLRGSPTN
jgi:hypothetical protein